MHREIPVSNRVLSRKWEEREQAFHYERLKGIRATLDTAKPALGSGTRARSKKEQMEEDRLLVIEQENRKLLERMSAIITAKPPVQTAASRGKSLNSEYRKKELSRVTIENQALLKRLQNRQSSYSNEQWRHDRKETERLLRNICQFPYVLGSESPSDMKRQMSQPQLLPSLPDSARQGKPRVLPPLKPTSKAETVLKRGLSLGEKYFFVEVITLKSKIKLKAMDVETQDRFVLKLTKAEARDLVGEGQDRYEKLIQRLAFQSQGLVLTGKRNPSKSTRKEPATERAEEASALSLKTKPKAPLPPAAKRPALSNSHTKSEPSLTIPRKDPAPKAIPKPAIPEEPIEHFPSPKPSAEPAEEDKAANSSGSQGYEDEHYEEEEVSPQLPVHGDLSETSEAFQQPLELQEAAQRRDSDQYEEAKEAHTSQEKPQSSHKSAGSNRSSKSSDKHKPDSAKRSSISSEHQEKEDDFQPTSSNLAVEKAAEQQEVEDFAEATVPKEQEKTESPQQGRSDELQEDMSAKKHEEEGNSEADSPVEVMEEVSNPEKAEQSQRTSEKPSPVLSPKQAKKPETPVKDHESPLLPHPSESPAKPQDLGEQSRPISPLEPAQDSSPPKPQEAEETVSPSQPLDELASSTRPQEALDEPRSSSPQPAMDVVLEPAENSISAPVQDLPADQRPESPAIEAHETDLVQPLEEEKSPISPANLAEPEESHSPLEVAAEPAYPQDASKPEAEPSHPQDSPKALGEPSYPQDSPKPAAESSNLQDSEKHEPVYQDSPKPEAEPTHLQDNPEATEAVSSAKHEDGEVGDIEENHPISGLVDVGDQPIVKEEPAQLRQAADDLEDRREETEQGKGEINRSIEQIQSKEPIEADLMPKELAKSEIEGNEEKDDVSPEVQSSEVLPIPSNPSGSDPLPPADFSPQS